MTRFTVFLLAAALAAGPLHAATQTIFQTNGDPALDGADLPILFGQFEIGEFDDVTTGFSIVDGLTIAFDPFDTSLGTLTEARLSWELFNGIFGSYYTDFGESDAFGGSWRARAELGIAWDDGSMGGFSSNRASSDGVSLTASGDIDGVSVGNAETGSALALDLSAVTSGPVTVDVASIFDSQGAAGYFDAMAEQFAAVTLTYTYEDDPVPAVPLPATLPLLLAVMAGLGLAARRR